MQYYHTSPWELKQYHNHQGPGPEPYPTLTWDRRGIGLEHSIFITQFNYYYGSYPKALLLSFFLFFQIIFSDNKKLVPVTIIKQSKFVNFLKFILILCKSNLRLK